MSQTEYCGSSVDNFHTHYRQWHGYVSLGVCILGTAANVLNIIVLTRRDMRSPTNAILTGLAVADLAVMLEYIPYAVHDYIIGPEWPREAQLTYGWACFVKFHAIFAQVLHTISIWLTVTLAVWRYLAVSHPTRSRMHGQHSMRTAITTIMLAYVICAIVTAPWLYAVTAIEPFNETLDANGRTVRRMPLNRHVMDYQQATNDADFSYSTMPSWQANGTLLAAPASELRNITVYRLYHSQIAMQEQNGLRVLTFLIYGVLIKLVPCCLLTFLSVRLICILFEAKRRRQQLARRTMLNMQPIINGVVHSHYAPEASSNSRHEKERLNDRTTRMLIAVLLLFLITEFPQGVMGLLNVLLGDAFLNQCYLKLSDLMDILALLNSSINFILYCTMSRQFRRNFSLLFRPRWLGKCLTEVQSRTAAVSTCEVLNEDLQRTDAISRIDAIATQVTNV